MTYDIIFSTKKWCLSANQIGILRELYCFSRLPSLMAADKPCPQLQPSIILIDAEPKSKLYLKIIRHFFEIEDDGATA